MKKMLQYMTWQEAKETFKSTKMAIIPTGSTEQHGPHLPLGTDYLIADYLAKKVAEKIDVVVLLLYQLALPIIILVLKVHYQLTQKYFPHTIKVLQIV